MTQEYVIMNMTWSEVGDAFDYAYMYETNEKHWAIKPYTKNKKISDWLERKDSFGKDLKGMLKRARSK